VPVVDNRQINFEELAHELVWTANSYIDGAIYVCEALIKDSREESPHDFRVPLHLAYLAVELFLKAGIAFSGKQFSVTHDLDKLQQEYDSSTLGFDLPIPSYFSRFTTPATLDLFKNDKAPGASQHFERLRYGTNRSGMRYPDLEIANLAQLNDELHSLHSAGSRLLWKICDVERRARKRIRTGTLRNRNKKK
jgi:hypothetical protein